MTMTEVYKPFIVMRVSGTSGNYVKAARNRAKKRMRLASRGLATPDIRHGGRALI